MTRIVFPNFLLALLVTAIFCFEINAQEVLQANFFVPGGMGRWSNPEFWSTNPLVPNNGNGGFDFDITSDSILEVDGDYTVNNASLNESSTTLVGDGSITVESEFLIGSIQGPGGSITPDLALNGNSSVFNVLIGNVVNSGSLMIGSGQSRVGTLILNAGEINIFPAVDSSDHHGNFENCDRAVLRINNSRLFGFVRNFGTLEISRNSEFAGILRQDAGVLHLLGGESAGGYFDGGKLIGNGVIGGSDFGADCVVSPGDSNNPIGVLEFRGGLFRFRDEDLTSEGGTLVLDVAGTAIGQYDQIELSFFADLQPTNMKLVWNVEKDFEASLNDKIFPIVNNVANGIIGQIPGIPEGQKVCIGSYRATASYLGNSDTNQIFDGDDFVLYNFHLKNQVILGDINLDCEVNLLDVEPFIALLANGKFQIEADINQDGAVNLLDIEGFVALLSGA